MKKNRRMQPPCATEGCPRPAQEGDRYCESCAIERSLYRRHERARGSPAAELPAR
jgi:hypothetical protein